MCDDLTNQRSFFNAIALARFAEIPMSAAASFAVSENSRQMKIKIRAKGRSHFAFLAPQFRSPPRSEERPAIGKSSVHVHMHTCEYRCHVQLLNAKLKGPLIYYFNNTSSNSFVCKIKYRGFFFSL